MNWQALTDEADGLGESPFWHPQEQSLYWVDIPGRRLRRCHPSTGQVETWAMPSEPGCVAPARRGGLVIALRDGVYRAKEWGDALQMLVAAQHDTATTRFNDGKCDRQGRFWVGSMYEPRDQRRAKLYCLDMRGGRAAVLEEKIDNGIIANGLDWSLDERTLFWAHTTDHAVHAWDWDAHANRLGQERVIHRFAEKPAGWLSYAGAASYGGRPDGAAVDAQGNYWVAMFEGKRIVKLSATGELLQELALPVQCATMPCFGGEDLRTLYLTTARLNRPSEELASQPMAGCVISTRVEVAGQPVNFFED